MKQLFRLKRESLPLQAEALNVDIVKAERERVESERMSRRAALRKIGIMSGGAVLALVSGDDLARMAAKQMQEHKETKAIGDKLAVDFRSAGVAYADQPTNPSATTMTRQQCRDIVAAEILAGAAACSLLIEFPPAMGSCSAALGLWGASAMDNCNQYPA